MFCTQALKAEADVQHLWFGRRAATRIRAELMSAIYDKALKRKDFSGIVNKDQKKEKEKDVPSGDGKKDKKAEKAKKEKADDPKAGADVGKIVNLMAGDANRVSGVAMLSTCSHLHCYHSDCHDHLGHVFHIWGSVWYVLLYLSRKWLIYHNKLCRNCDRCHVPLPVARILSVRRFPRADTWMATEQFPFKTRYPHLEGRTRRA